MLTMSHVGIAKNTLKFLRSKGLDLLDEKKFIKGNIKPDCLFQKTPHKHLEVESLEFILKEINLLHESWVYMDKDELSIKMGIVCHYLCDYFCLPHFERWSACALYKKVIQTPKHLNYERKLCSYIDKATLEYREIDNLVEFLDSVKKEYVLNKSFENDIKFATLVCNSVSLYILK